MITTSARALSIAACMAAAALLSGRGGGGDGPSTGMPAGGDVAPPPAEPPLDRLSESADTLLMTDFFVHNDDVTIRIRTDCNGASCTLGFLEESETTSLSDIFEDPDGGEELAATETHRGVSLARWPDIYAEDDLIGDFEGYAGWLEHNVFAAGHATLGDEEIGFVSIPFGMSFGDATGTNPTSAGGGAAWSGIMTGAEVGAAASRPNEIRGDADLTIADFADPRIGVAFTSIRDLATGAPRDDMTWSAIPLTDGRFGTGSDGNSIQGSFYGPDHGEVGGVFERDRIFGAFGARRQ